VTAVTLGGIPVLPAGTTLPPLPYLISVVGAAAAVGIAFRRQRPPVSPAHVLALAPWMALGATAHVLYVIDGLPGILTPLGGSPTVYLTVATLAASVWLAAQRALADASREPLVLGAVGTLAFVGAAAATLSFGIAPHGVWWSGVAAAIAVVSAVVTWRLLLALTPAVAATGWVGQLVVFGHAFDGISTAIGVTHLGFGERSPLSELILEFDAVSVPVFETAWVFVVIKLAIAGVVTWLFVPYVRETPREGRLLLGAIAAVGVGPAVHNVLLFSVAT